MTDQKNQIINSAKEIDAVGTINYIYEMALSLKLMANKVNEPLLVFLLELLETESMIRLQHYKDVINQIAGTRETKPPE